METLTLNNNTSTKVLETLVNSFDLYETYAEQAETSLNTSVWLEVGENALEFDVDVVFQFDSGNLPEGATFYNVTDAILYNNGDSEKVDSATIKELMNNKYNF